MGNEALRMSRIAAWGMNQLLRQYELGSMAEKFNGDDDRWQIDAPKAANAIINDRLAGRVEFSDDVITIYIPDIYQCIRSAHIGSFDPALHGILVKTGQDFKGDTPDDIVAEIDLDNCDIPYIDQPRRYVPKSPIKRKFRCKGALA